tara:strand:+ start:6743 stop:7891 length:1149 start_codon:yes stop_codon:yes gene_type:complete
MSAIKPIRLGMVGGGRGAFIGEVHRVASRLDNKYCFCAGALSSDPKKSKLSGIELGLDEDRSYGTYEEMIQGESMRDDRIEAVSIVTPNNMHFPIAKKFLEAGCHVICDKPMTISRDEADQLINLASKQNLILAVTYNYSGYPMIRQARAMVKNGKLGKIRVVQGEYSQDWLSEPIERDGQKQAYWRTDPEQSGIGGCVGDIGTHAYHLICYVSGLKAEALCADISTFVNGRKLDDNANILLRFKDNAKGMIWVSQVAVGNENNLKIRIYGEKGGLSWNQENPNELIFSPLNKSSKRITRGGSDVLPEASKITRLPAGHPEGYLEGFATIYSEIAESIIAARNGNIANEMVDYPSGEDGMRGVIFIESVVNSSAAGSVWVNL